MPYFKNEVTGKHYWEYMSEVKDELVVDGCKQMASDKTYQIPIDVFADKQRKYKIKIFRDDNETTYIESKELLLTLAQRNNTASKLKRIQSGDIKDSFDIEGVDGISYIVPSIMIRDRLVTIEKIDSDEPVKPTIKSFVVNFEYNGFKCRSIELDASGDNIDTFYKDLYTDKYGDDVTLPIDDGTFIKITKEMAKEGKLTVEFVY